MQPYQRATDATIQQSEEPTRLLKKVGGTALGIAGGGAVLNRIKPLLSQYVPAEMAVKGLSKISPPLGKFIDGAINKGHTINEALDFVRDKVEPDKKQGPLSLISGYSPELADYIMQKVSQGENPEKVAMYLSVAKPNEVEKVEKGTGEKFIDLVLRLLGSKSATQPPQQAAQPQQAQQVMQPQQPQPQQAPQPQQQAGQGQQALMAILQKIQQSRGG